MTCPSTFSQVLVSRLIENDNREAVRNEYKKRSIEVQALLNKKNIEFIKPDGTFYLMIKTTFIDADSLIAADIILEECKVAVVPGSAYGKSTKEYVRMSLVQPVKSLVEAVERIANLKNGLGV